MVIVGRKERKVRLNYFRRREKARTYRGTDVDVDSIDSNGHWSLVVVIGHAHIKHKIGTATDT